MVIWSEPAKADSIHDFIACDSAHYAKKVADDIVSRTDVLGVLPRLGRVVPEIGDETIREFSLYSWRIFYEVPEARVFVLAVIHKRRQLQTEPVQRRAT